MGQHAVRRSWSILGAAVLLVLLLTACGNPPELITPTPSPEITVTPTTAAPAVSRATPVASPSPKVASPVSYASQAETLNALLAPEQGVYGVVVATPQGKILYSRNADLPFITASLYKLVVAADVYNLEAEGQLSMDEELTLEPADFSDDEPGEPDSMYSTPDIGTQITIKQAMFAMVSYSSNVAGLALVGRVGADSINEMAAQLGLDHTRFQVTLDELPDWPPQPGPDSTPAAAQTAQKMIENWCAQYQTVSVTTPRDITKFLSMIYQGEVVSPQASQDLLTLLKEQAVDNKFPVLLPAGTTLAHKTGDLDGFVHHDVGIIYAPTGPVILTAMSTAVPNDYRSWQVIQRLAYIVYGHNSWPSFESQPPPDEGESTASASTAPAGTAPVVTTAGSGATVGPVSTALPDDNTPHGTSEPSGTTVETPPTGD